MNKTGREFRNFVEKQRKQGLKFIKDIHVEHTTVVGLDLSDMELINCVFENVKSCLLQSFYFERSVKMKELLSDTTMEELKTVFDDILQNLPPQLMAVVILGENKANDWETLMTQVKNSEEFCVTFFELAGRIIDNFSMFDDKSLEKLASLSNNLAVNLNHEFGRRNKTEIKRNLI